MTRRRGRRRKFLWDYIKETRRYWTLTDEALDLILQRTRIERGYGPGVKETTECVNE